jgi:hypothetical protein
LNNESDIVVNEFNKATLSVHCSEQGFSFKLQCSDGKSWANSQMFTWQQIAQLLIAADPDMFGDLDEPWHQCFLDTLVQLGYNVPDWPVDIT